MHPEQAGSSIAHVHGPSTVRARVALAAAVALTALLLAATASQAATITYSRGADGAVVYTATAGETLNVTVGYEAGCGTNGGTPVDCVTFYGNATTWSPTDNCQAQSDGSVWCLLDGDRSGVHVVGGAGDDKVSVLDADLSGFPASTPYAIAIDGGAGNDVLDGGSAGETMHGGPGADRLGGRGGSDVLFGDDGNDELLGDGFSNGNESSDGGSDKLYGGAGDDTLTGDATGSSAKIGADLLDGGPGSDKVDDDWYRYMPNDTASQDPPPTVTLDGVANDGRPGERDDVVGVETISTGYMPNQATPATFVGSNGPDTFNLLFAHGSVRAAGGDDVVTGSDYPDAIDGGPGNDKLSGGFGDDDITGGPGRDDIGGDRTAACFYGPIFGSCTIGTGNDTIHAQDGEADTIDCGPGNDTADVDAVDKVTACETVHVAAVNSKPGTTTKPGTTRKPGTKPAAKAKVKLTVPKQRLAKIRRAKVLKVRCKLPAAGRCTVTATITKAAARKLHLKVAKRARTYRLGIARKAFKRAGTATIRIKLSPRTRRALRRAHKLKITITATATGPKLHRSTARLSRRFA